ncbi:LOW QUALITY PROTEIN: hypothetical protein Ct61P_12907 [Colletotrichum tofieldiae]|nr:LOW QUALITY PROTEIN: hypothetical protein Ct61P_12907 [Colletotrichum tofieldiae]
MPQTPKSPPRRDSWPPTLVRLAPTTPKDYPSLDDIDEDPLTYFLTPAPDLEDADENVDMMDFNAGIEDNSPREVRQPVNIGRSEQGQGPRVTPVPDLSDLATPDTDEEEEDYIRFAPHGFMIPFSLRDFTIDGGKSKALSKPSDVLLSPSSLPLTRGRPPVRSGGEAASGSSRSATNGRSTSGPSPDVWSIEEETEEELMSEMGSSIGFTSDIGDVEDVAETRMDEDVEAAKPKKKVRFLLPAME